jgi:diaminopimelate decarboxylase
LVRRAVRSVPTPFYLFSPTPIEEALRDLSRLERAVPIPVRHWYSCKTQPVAPVLRWWRDQGRDIEVVSEFEFLAARAAGFAAERILVNGPAKHHWLPRYVQRGLLVNLDSAAEARVLAPLARKLDWTVGVRLNTRAEFDPESPDHPTQFGMVGEELVEAFKELKRSKVVPQIMHLHLRTNVASAAIYVRALAHAAEMCRNAGFSPKFMDCGGGFPPPHVLTREGRRIDAIFSLRQMAAVYAQAFRLFPSARELWLENGRWLSARSGVLVVRILDVKERRGMRHLICDGGRTLNALVSTWEAHELLTLPARGGPKCPTTVTGPTCMAFDQLARRPLPRSLRPGDHLIWLEAGAYHLSWETRFSHGLAAVLWHDGRRVRLVRRREPFRSWWEQWE